MSCTVVKNLNQLTAGDIISPAKHKPTYIHVNQHNIRKNIKGENLPVITIKRGSDNFYANGVKINGEVELVYSADNPILKCGARLVMITNDNVEVTK